VKLRYRIGRKLLEPRAKEMAEHYEKIAKTIPNPDQALRATYVRLGIGVALHDGDNWSDLVEFKTRKRPGS